MSRNDDARIWATRDRARAQPRIRAHAKRMRATSTEAEKKLWWHLRHRLKTAATHFRRQVVIDGYIADFASHSAKLILEVDGGQHSEREQADLERTRVFETHGYRVLRFWNDDVLKNIDGVLSEIQRAITTTPTPIPSPQGGGEEYASRTQQE